MIDPNFSCKILVDQTPDEVFLAVNRVSGWWSGEVLGESEKLGDEFTYHFPGIHFSRQKVTESIPGKKTVWHVTDAELTFVSDKQEWIGTDIVFEIEEGADQTELHFTHVGLSPSLQCYGSCANAWSILVTKNLRNLIITGADQPTPWPEA